MQYNKTQVYMQFENLSDLADDCLDWSFHTVAVQG